MKKRNGAQMERRRILPVASDRASELHVEQFDPHDELRERDLLQEFRVGGDLNQTVEAPVDRVLREAARNCAGWYEESRRARRRQVAGPMNNRWFLS